LGMVPHSAPIITHEAPVCKDTLQKRLADMGDMAGRHALVIIVYVKYTGSALVWPEQADELHPRCVDCLSA